MKIYILKLCLLSLLLCNNNCIKCQEHNNAEVATIEEKSNKVKELTTLESEMINLFQETLENNYGSKDAIDLLVKGMNKYYHIYILEVDKSKLQKINKKLYSKGWLYSYFLDGKELGDSCLLFVPEGMTIEQYRCSAKYQQDLKRKNIDGAIVGFAPDSARYMSYAPDRARIENLAFPLAMYKLDGFSYYQRELVHASRPAIKKIAEQIYATGATPSSVLWGIISHNLKEFANDFKTDRDTQMFMTLYCWKYLCHSANIDFYSGKDRTEILLKEEAHK